MDTTNSQKPGNKLETVAPFLPAGLLGLYTGWKAYSRCDDIAATNHQEAMVGLQGTYAEHHPVRNFTDNAVNVVCGSSAMLGTTLLGAFLVKKFVQTAKGFSFSVPNQSTAKTYGQTHGLD